MFSEKTMLSDFPVQLFTVSNCTPIFKSENLIEIIIDNLNILFSENVGSDGKLNPLADNIQRHNYYR